MKKFILFLIVFLVAFDIFGQTQVRIVGRTESGENKFVMTNGDGELVTMDITHHKIHYGEHFFYSNINTLGSGDSVKYILITPPDSVSTKNMYWLFQIDGSAITEVRIYETNTDSGLVAQTLFNNDRNSTNLPYFVVKKGSTYKNLGTLMYNYKGGSAQGSSRSGGNVRAESEIILKQNTQYKIKIISGTADNLVSVIFRWYEE